MGSTVRRTPDYGKTASVVEIGQVVGGKYKLLRLLGDGGMGSVYEASHEMLGTHVAVKVLHSELLRRSGLIERFLQEARVSAQIRSPHVVQVTDVDRTPEGVAYLVMELLQGEPLASVVKREGKLSVATACEYTLQILSALEAAHALGVIHRDLKPDNVFLTYAGGKPVIKLIDFGIAKLKRAEGSAPQAKNLTVAGMLMGTPEYMAPEQAYAADKVDVRADLYSVGCMLYEMLSGQTPVSGEDPRVVVLKVERGEVTPLVHLSPQVPPEVAGFVHRAMAPRPEMRFSNATEMRIALEAIASGKRAGTAPLAAALANTADARDLRGDASPAHAHAQHGSGPPPAAEIGTGTVLGAPAAAALAGMDQRPGTSTVKAAPIDPSITRAQPSPMGPHGAMGPPPMHAQPQHAPHVPMASSYTGAPEPTRLPPRRSGNGLVIALALVALLLGAGAVFAYVANTQTSETPTVPFPTETVATTTATAPVPTATTTTPAGTTAPPPTSAPPLTPGPQVPGNTPGTTPTKPPSTNPPQTSRDAGATPTQPPPSSTPTTIPPFTLPSGFPTAFPSTLPPMPSGFPPFPSGFPQWPPPQ